MTRTPTFNSEEEYDDYLEKQAEEKANQGTELAECYSCGREFRADSDWLTGRKEEEINCPPDEAFRLAIEKHGIVFDTAFAEELRTGRISGVDLTVADVERISRSIEQPTVIRVPVATHGKFYSGDRVADTGR